MAQNKIVTSVSALTDNIISPTENVVCIDTRNSRIGVNKSQPLFEIDVNGQINSSILTTANTTINSSGITTNSITSNNTTINSSGITSNNSTINSSGIITNSITCISGTISNLICSANFQVKSIMPYNNDISININGNLVIESSLNSLKTTNLIVRNINPFTNSDISINGNVWIDGSLNVKGTSTVLEMNVNYVILRSDDRLKHNEQNIENALLTIRKLNPQIYQKTTNFKDIHYHGSINEHYILEAGLIAQEVEKIDELKFSVINGNKETPYSINYNNIFIYCLAALKELDNNVESIKNVLNLNTTSNSGSNNHDLVNIINNQNNQIQELINKVNILENRISTIESAF